jgi:beta-lactam-binding protein with PASTA domain
MLAALLAAALLSATLPAAAQERRIAVPDLAEPAARERFGAVFLRTCDRPADIREEPVAASRSAPGTVIGQAPPAGSTILCTQPVIILRVAAPPQQTPTDRTPEPAPQRTTPGAGQQILDELLEGLANPPPPKNLTVPDLAPEGALAAFEAETRSICGRRLRVEDKTEESRAPPGSIIAQRPAVGTILSCRRPTVILTRAVALPTPPPEAPPAAAPALFVPSLLTPAARETFEAVATRFCGRPIAITLRRRETAGPAGRFLAQSPPQGTRYACGTPVSVTLSSTGAATPAPRPERPAPEQPVATEPAPPPAEPPPQPSAEPAPVGSPPPAAGTAGPPAATDEQPEPSPQGSGALPPPPPPPAPRTPPAALIAAAVALLAGGFLAGRLLSRRSPAPRPAPQPGIRRGTPRVTTTLDAPPDLAGPALAVRWRRPTVHAEAAPAIAREEIDHG